MAQTAPIAIVHARKHDDPKDPAFRHYACLSFFIGVVQDALSVGYEFA